VRAALAVERCPDSLSESVTVRSRRFSERNDDREQQHDRIENDVRSAGKTLGVGGEHRPQAGKAQGDAENPANEGEEYALGQELPEESEASGAEGRTNRKLLLSRLGARQQQVGKVRAGNQEHETHCPLQHPERGRNAADEILLKAVEAQAMILRVGCVNFRIELVPLNEHALHVCSGLNHAHVVPQATNEVEEMAAAVSGVRGIQRQRQPDLHLRVVNVVAGGHDAHDARRNAVDADDAAHG
jgi:hypothetical protein